MSGLTLAARMKRYEHTYRRPLPRRTYTLLRLDGKGFSTYTRRLDKPFDAEFASDMATAAKALCAEASGVAFAYVASDEISVLLTDFATHTTEPWLGGIEAKVLSISASIVTAAFNQARRDRGDERLAYFDSRVFTLSDPFEVSNYFLWRQRDTEKNSVSMAASAHFPHQRLHGLTTNQRQDLLFAEAGVNWNDYPVWAKRGSVVVRTPRDGTVAQRSGAEYAAWQALGAPRFSGADDWLQNRIPAMAPFGPGPGQRPR